VRVSRTEEAPWESQVTPGLCAGKLYQGKGRSSVLFVAVNGNYILDKMYLFQIWPCPACSCGSCDEIPEMQAVLSNS